MLSRRWSQLLNYASNNASGRRTPRGQPRRGRVLRSLYLERLEDRTLL
jgi:hypothetical protein